MNFQKLTENVCEIAFETAEIIRKEAAVLPSIEIETKSLNNFVTRVDKNSEKFIVEKLRKLLPEAGFIVEENTVDFQGKDFNWIVDPLDGTTNFIHGIPCYSISIALSQNDKIVSGVVYEINLKECFSAYKDGPSILNGKEIHVSKKQKLADSLLATGFPYHDYNRLQEYLNLLSELVRNTHGIRRLGSAAVDLAYNACGRFEGFYEYGLNPWDVAAGSLIVEQAGGKVSDFNGENNYIFGQEMVSSNFHIHTELLDVIKKYFPK